MQVGQYSCHGVATPFLITDCGAALDWTMLISPEVPAEVRLCICRARETGRDAEFLAALGPLEQYLSTKPVFVADAGRAFGFEVNGGATVLPPVRPRNFICIGLNYLDHARESNMELPARPLLFAKTANAIAGHGHRVPVPHGAAQLDYEAELAVVIGKTCRRATVENALDFVAGYTCANDVSARDFQFADGQWYRGKSCDGFGPLGPWLVTKSEIPDPRAVAVRCRLNGKIMQDSTTANLIFGIAELIAFVSNSITLEPGDVISTGTPPGVGFARKPPVYLQAGDTVEVEIPKIGVLRNFIGEEATAR